MIDTSGPHSGASFWLDVVDRVIKFLALLVGAAWTWMHYARSRTYAQKLELELDGQVFFNKELYLEVVLKLKNLGAARHPVQELGTSCSVWAISRGLAETPILGTSVFQMEEWIEPNESINDSKVFRIDHPIEEIVWLKISLRVESEGREWNLTRHIRVEIVDEARGEA